MKKFNKNGFTLIEILLYTGIFAIVGGLMTGVLLTVTQVQQRESASAEVTGQLNLVMQTINRLVRESSNIEIAAGTTVSTLKLRMEDTTKDPTCISLVSGVIKLAEGPGTNPNDCTTNTSDLTSDRVTVDTFNFKKFTQYPGHDTVSIDIQMTYNSTNPKSQVQRTLSSAIARVSAATFDSALLPGSDNAYDVGYSPSTRWRNAALSGNLLVSGNVGIGTTSPLARLGVVGADALNTSFAANIGGSTGTGLVVTNAGNVGIGTTTPSYPLSVTGHVYFNGDVELRKDSSWLYILSTDTAGNSTLRIGTDTVGDSTNPLQITRYGATATGNNNFGISKANSAEIGEYSGGTFTIGTYFNAPLYLATYGSLRMTILGSGNVGIGTTTPTTAKLVVDGTISASTPTADSHVATKAYVDAAGGSATYYQTASTYAASVASTACASGYHMCMVFEWYGRSYNTTAGSDGTLDLNSWVDTNTDSGDTYRGDCLNWSTNSIDYKRHVASIFSNPSPAWNTETLFCSYSFRVLCCSN